MYELRKLGHTISYDWTRDADEYPNNDAPESEYPRLARSDLDGIRAADVVIVLNSPVRTAGKWIEMGAALALEKILIVVGPAEGSGAIFASLADVRVRTDVDAIDLIRVSGFVGLNTIRRERLAATA